MSRHAPPIVLSPDEAATLDTWARSRTLPARVVERARIVQLAAHGVPNQEIARPLGVSRPTVQLWREQFLALRVAGLGQDAPRPGHRPRIAEAKTRAVLEATLHSTPPHATHWSTRTMAVAQGLSLDGRVIGDCMPRHRHQEVRFLQRIDSTTPPALDLHLVVEHYRTHKPPRVQGWLPRHPRFHVHFTPTSSSWLNLVERWFRDLTTTRPRRGSFGSVAEFITAIHAYLDNLNQNPQVFAWSAPVERILAKIANCNAALDAPHQRGPTLRYAKEARDTDDTSRTPYPKDK